MGRSVYLYESVIDITKVYLGPAADRFIDRQIRNHLHKDPESIAKKDLLELIDWIKVAMGFLTEDSQLVDSYASDLLRLVKERDKSTSI